MFIYLRIIHLLTLINHYYIKNHCRINKSSHYYHRFSGTRILININSICLCKRFKIIVNRDEVEAGRKKDSRANFSGSRASSLPLKPTFWGTRRDAFNIFIANTLDCARHFQRIGRMREREPRRGENEKSRQRDARVGSRCRILSLAEGGPVTEIRDSSPVLHPSLQLFLFP